MAYVVGSASVQIVPDFRQAQLKITEFFEKQKNEIRVPIKPEMSPEAERRAVEQSKSISEKATAEQIRQQGIVERLRIQSDTRLSAIERENELRLQRIREQGQIIAERQQRNQAENRSREDARRAQQLFLTETRNEARLEAERLKNIRARESAEQRAAQRTATEAERLEAQRSRKRLDDLNFEHKTWLENEKTQVKFLEDDARKVARILAEDEKARIKLQVKIDKDSVRATEQELGHLGSVYGILFGETIARNAEREMRSRATFLAAVAGAILAAGGPAVALGATTLFAGIGLAASAQNDEVKASWRSLWQDILRTSKDDSQALVGAHLYATQRIGQSYERMRPLLREAFNDSVPVVEKFTDSVTNAAEIALPGMVDIVRHAGPVMDGLDAALTGIASGLDRFFESIANGSGPVGQALGEIGELLGAILPPLGDLLVIGAQVASDVLPVLTTGFRFLGFALDHLGPVLPIVLDGLLAMRAANSLGRIFDNAGSSISGFGQKIAIASGSSGKMSTAVSGLGTGLTKLGAVMPAVGLVAGLVGYAFQRSAQEVDEFGQRFQDGLSRLREGGTVAAEARRELEALRAAASKLPSGALSEEIDKQEAAYHRLWKTMSPLAQAQSKVAEWSATLNSRMKDETSTSGEIEAAKRRLQYWTLAEARAQAEANAAMKDGVPAAQAAKTALEDYQRLLAAGDRSGALQALSTYNEKTMQAAEDQRQLNIATQDYVPAAQAASAAQQDWANAILRADPKAAGEALDRYREKTLEAELQQEAWNTAILGSGETLKDAVGSWGSSLDIYQQLLQAKSTEERKAAEETAKNTVSASDSWQDYAKTTNLSLDEVAAKLEEQIQNQLNWEGNLTTVSARAGSRVATILAQMGKDGVDLTAKMATGTADEVARMARDLIANADAAGRGTSGALETRLSVMAQVASKAGSDTAQALAKQLQDGTITVEEIAKRYGIVIAQGVNPVLLALGKSTLQTTLGNLFPQSRNLWTGGYSGDGGKYEPKGVVHGGEFVTDKERTTRLRPLLETFQSTPLHMLPQYASGGFVFPDDVPKPYSVAPYSGAVGLPGSAAMEKEYAVTREWLSQNFGSAFTGMAGAGVQRWLPMVIAALHMMGQPESLAQTVLRRMNQESGGNPAAVNRTDSNWLRGTPSVGLMQVIGPTYRSFKDSRRDVGPYLYGSSEDPLSNLLASMHYALSRYGSLAAAYNKPGGYANGGTTPANAPFWVGENGPELMWSNRQQYVSSASQSQEVSATEGLRMFRKILGGGFGVGGPVDTGQQTLMQVAGAGGGPGTGTVAGIVNHGTIVVADEREMARQAEISKRQSLIAAGII